MRNWLKNNRGFLVFLVCLGFFRTAIADWNPIPSGSMRPTLVEGDVVLVNRLAFDFKLPLTDIALARLGEPQRGDIVTFSSPRDGVRLIKRIVALPGDTVEMRHDVLWVNGQPAQYEETLRRAEPVDGVGEPMRTLQAMEQWGTVRHAVQFIDGLPARRDFAPLTVPQDCFFMMGDNRNNSGDSRYFGVVPRRLIIGRAHRVLVSADIQGQWLPRWQRWGQALAPAAVPASSPSVGSDPG